MLLVIIDLGLALSVMIVLQLETFACSGVKKQLLGRALEFLHFLSLLDWRYNVNLVVQRGDDLVVLVDGLDHCVFVLE